MDAADHLSHLGTDGQALAGAARSAPDAVIPTCPGWDMTALVGHTSAVHHWVDQIVSSGATEYLARSAVPPEGFDATLAWYEEGLQSLGATLAAADPEALVWNWRDRRPAPTRFWIRRMAQETAIHRWDGANGAHPDQAAPIAADLAVDGIDEYLSFLGPWLAYRPIAAFHGSLHLHATDTAGEWSLNLRPDGVDLAREHRKSDAAIRAPASDLYLWLVNRIPADGPQFQCFGDEGIIASWRQLEF